MTSLVYPRLPYSATQRRISEIENAYQGGGLGDVEALAAHYHPDAAPVATGGQVADDHQIALVRKSVVAAVAPWREGGRVATLDRAAFDLAAGKALHESMRIIPGDAAHGEVWNFLTTVVLPDVAVLRFPDMHPDRMYGGNRNTFWRIWIRRDTLGDLTDRYARPLGEDEMTGLFERSAMARNRPLIRALATTVMEYAGDEGRSNWARQVYKKVRYLTGPRALDGWTEDELTDLVRQQATNVR